MFSPPHSIELAYLVRQVLVWSWRLFPFVYAMVAIAIFIHGNATCKRRIVWYGVSLLFIFGLIVTLLTLLMDFSIHGQSSLYKSFVLLGKELVSPDAYSLWPSYQFPAAIVCYSILLFLAVTCVRSRRVPSVSEKFHK